MIQPNVTSIDYADTHRFSSLVLDYLSDKEQLKPFYSFRPNIEGIQKAIEAKRETRVDRSLLVEKWNREYKNLPEENEVLKNIQRISDENTFTICTAHQPNIFTGPIYFIYKIQHAIKLAKELNEEFTDAHFVPVYYMGSEDADLDEIGTVLFHDTWIKWGTKQKGAVGRMKVDDAFLLMLTQMESIAKQTDSDGTEISLFRKHYQLGKTIAEATFGLVHELFGKQGLLILNADDVTCKKMCSDIFREDLFRNQSNNLLMEGLEKFPSEYRVQASGREINLFYIDEDIRSRIERKGDRFIVHDTSFSFSEEEIEEMLVSHPDRFSPNVILRPLLQERLLPNVAFVGGGSELGYWMQLKNIFYHYGVAYPVLILRNSFALVDNELNEALKRFNIEVSDLFRNQSELELILLQRNGVRIPNLEAEREKINEIYAAIQTKSSTIEKTLVNHVDALRHKAEKRLIQLEKKMIRLEKKKHTELFFEVKKLQEKLLPNGNLQERTENYFSLRLKYGSDLMDCLYNLQQPFSESFSVVCIPNSNKG
jgi:bacillithiol biosynthesis cysteine-adding enzyme BshC